MSQTPRNFIVEPVQEIGPRWFRCHRRLVGCFPLVCLLTLICVTEARAQWTTQTIQLRPGWNAVFLEVQPEPRDCDSVFAGLPVESVSAWNRRFSTVQFLQDPEELLLKEQDWLTYVPAAQAARPAQSLFVLEGGRSYLIKLSANSPPVTWTLRGRPALRSVQWVPDSFNFVGFTIDAGNPPSFESFFAGSPAHAGKPVYRLNSQGHWEKVSSPATTTLRAGEAFWIRCNGPSSYEGPLSIVLQQRSGLDYGRMLIEQPVSIINHSTGNRTLTIRPLPSELPPASQPALAGPVPLSYYRMDLSSYQVTWLPLETVLVKGNIGSGQQWDLRLGVRRVDMEASAANLYQSLLEVTDNAGSRMLIPISAYPLQYDAAVGPIRQGAGHPYAGLWVGNALIDKVSQPSNIGAPDTPVSAASQFPFRLIIHVNTNGEPQLLRQVLLSGQEATYTNDANGIPVLAQPRGVRLLTDDTLIDQASANRALKARRITSAAFGFSNAQPMTVTGSFGVSNSTASCQIALGYDARLNPFKHRYHPEHDNLDARFESVQPAGVESYDITRNLNLRFGSTNVAGLPQPGWGDSHLGGDYTELISGLHQQPLRISGTFHIERVSSVATLNGANP